MFKTSLYGTYDSTDFECIEHASKLYIEKGYKHDIVIQLRPAQPCRTSQLVDDYIEKFLEVRHEYDSLEQSLRMIGNTKCIRFQMIH